MLQFYLSRNAFVVHRCGHNGILRTIKSYFGDKLACLTSLRIEVNNNLIPNTAYVDDTFHRATVSVYQRGWQVYPWPQRDVARKLRYCRCYPNDPIPEGLFHPYKYCLCTGVDEPLSTTSYGAGRLAQKELRDTAQLLRSSIKPGQLDLGIICDCKNIQTAKAFVSALEGLPRLRSFALRLAAHVDPRIRQLAEETVQQHTVGDSRSSKLSGFSKLPAELRREVLKNTDLVAPKDIELNSSWPYAGFRLQHQPYERQHVCQAVTEMNTKSISFSTSCKCWRFPLNLFLVNKEFHEEATQIFYSYNHFIVLLRRCPPEYLNWASDYYWHHIARSTPQARFFSRLPPSALKHLRSVQLCFPKEPAHFDREMFGNTHLIFEQDIKIMATQVSLSKLALTLDFSSSDESIGEINEHGYRKCCKKHSFLEMCNEALRVVTYQTSKTRRTHGTLLKDFFVYFPEDVEESIASEWEKKAVGDDYESVKRGKYAHRNRYEYWASYLKRTAGYPRFIDGSETGF
ncbi:hypothetical protein BT63DRAFT_71398 [Microthyrium microscopicum]|uniref:F-box domain-containing protein n=1 Tax=Microthyrium microscopicum TaxID=703497 RepID=A0A6A6U238_9PEZI|nr:hypothetical protein BT63DRAFT_71398 [Microthyrium microscopicum]